MPVTITQDLAGAVGAYLQQNKYTHIGVLCDTNTHEHCYPLLEPQLPTHHLVVIQPGEEFKTLDTCVEIWGWMTEEAFDRKSLLINLGGGVIGDMGGFCASTYKRGIDFINLPTTLLSQVDASVGGKLGVDFQGLKNHIGVFREPQLVIIYAEFLKTLPERELRSGFAEVIKHALIRDNAYWPEISGLPFAAQPWESRIAHSVKVKEGVVAEDPTEKGLRKILNFGHTIGHAIESHYLPKVGQKLLHGEAIAIGMLCEAYLSTKKCGLSTEGLAEIERYILANYPAHPMDAKEFPDISALALQDKKNEGKTIQASLLKSIGDCTFNIPITQEEIIDTLFYYQKLTEA